jgi:hypothetical protein
MGTEKNDPAKRDAKPNELELLKSSVDSERARLRYRLENGPPGDDDGQEAVRGKSRGKLNRIFRLCLGD